MHCNSPSECWDRLNEGVVVELERSVEMQDLLSGDRMVPDDLRVYHVYRGASEGNQQNRDDSYSFDISNEWMGGATG